MTIIASFRGDAAVAVIGAAFAVLACAGFHLALEAAAEGSPEMKLKVAKWLIGGAGATVLPSVALQLLAGEDSWEMYALGFGVVFLPAGGLRLWRLYAAPTATVPAPVAGGGNA